MSNIGSQPLQGAQGAQGMGAQSYHGQPVRAPLPNPWPSPVKQMLTVSDVARLAQAGVKINFAEIADMVRPDDTKSTTPLVDAFWQRWHRANPGNPMMLPPERPWAIAAAPCNDKVYVFVAPFHGGVPFILEDEKILFPSDTLMAKLHLREHVK